MLADFLEIVDDLVRDAAQWVTPAQRDRAVGLALARYSKDRPRELVEDVVVADGVQIPLPTAWAQGASDLRTVECPVVTPPVPLDSACWYIYRTPLGEQIGLVSAVTQGTTARVAYSGLHLLTDTDDTIPADHLEAVACYAASLLAEQVATVHANSSDSTISADSVDRSHPAREWAARAKSYRNRYFTTLGIEINAQGVEQPRMEAAGVVVDMELPSTTGRGRLYRRG